MSELFYSVNEDPDMLRASDIDEAMVEWLEGDVYDEPLDSLPETIEVHEWKLMGVKPNTKVFEWGLEHILECLDENYTYEDFVGEYKPSEEVLRAYDKFKEVLIKDFKPTLMECTGNTDKVNVKQWIKDYRWSDD